MSEKKLAAPRTSPAPAARGKNTRDEPGREPSGSTPHEAAAAIDKLKKLHGEAAAAAKASTVAPAAKLAEHAGTAGPKGDAAALAEREAGLLELLRIEGEARDVLTVAELYALMANAPRRLMRARQIFVLRRVVSSWRVVAVSALPTVDRTAPLVKLVEQVGQRLEGAETNSKPRDFRISAFAEDTDETAASYPMQDAIWLPLLDRNGAKTGGVILTRETPWQERDLVIAARLGGAFQHALSALEGGRRILSAKRHGLRVWLGASLALVLLGLVPVSLTTLAPVEIVPRDPFIVAAPIEGAIEDIPVEPNSRVRKGDLLVKFESTTLRNKLEVSEREVLVAQARLKTTTQLAFADARGRHDLAVAGADLVLKRAERDFARELLEKAEIRAPTDGLVVFNDKNELIGRPMAVGERILEIADAKKVELRMDVPVADAIILKDGARVKVLLDSDPLAAREAEIIHSDYQARPSDANVLSFRAIARLTDDAAVPRLGARGSAQIYGDKVLLAFYLLRRPFAKLRQWTGQ